MKSGVFAFAGPIAGGKTSLASCAATVLGVRMTSFSAVLGDMVRSRGLAATRYALQEVGADVVETSPDELCRQVLRRASWSGSGSVVIDGLRHRSIAANLEQLASPAKLWIVYVEAPFESRRRRVSTEVGCDVLPEWEGHRAEKHVSELHELSDLVLTNSGALADSKTVLAEWLRQ